MFYLLCLKQREPGRISQSQLVSLKLLPRLMVSVGKSKVILFQISSNIIGNKGQKHKIPAKESIYLTKINFKLGSVTFLKKRTIYGTLVH